MVQKTEQLPHAEGFIVSEAPGALSRESVTIIRTQGATAVSVKAGTVMGKRDDGKWEQLAVNSSEGNNVAAGVLCSEVDATAADAKGVVLERLAEVRASDLIWPAGISQGQKDTAIAQLLTKNIKVRSVAATVETQIY